MHAYPEPSSDEYEHVYLATEEPEEQAPSFPSGVLLADLKQALAHIAVFDQGQVYVRLSQPSGRTQFYWLNLAFLDPRPLRAGGRPWWYAATALAGIGGLQLLLAHHALLDWSPASILAAGAAFAGAVAAVVIGLGRHFGRLVFCTRHGRTPVLELTRGRSDRQRVRGFLRLLEAAIRNAAEPYASCRTQLLRDEMREHRRLLEAGVFKAREYERAQARILRAHG